MKITTSSIAFDRTSKSAFTLIELLVVIAIIAILASILFPVFGRARENARRSTCQSNLKQIGLGMAQYEQDFDERFPPIQTVTLATQVGPYTGWPLLMQPYVKSAQIFDCPSLKYRNTTILTPDMSAAGGLVALDVAYGLNAATSTGANDITPANTFKGKALSIVQNAAELGLLYEDNLTATTNQCKGYYATSAGYTTAGNPGQGHPVVWWTTHTTDNPGLSGNYDYGTPDARHFAGLNVCFADGHVKWLQYDKVINPPAGVTNANWRLWHPDAP